jgi:hypothetical protein
LRMIKPTISLDFLTAAQGPLKPDGRFGAFASRKGHGKELFHKIAPDLRSSARRIQRRISRLVSVDAMQEIGKQTGQKTSKMWNHFLLWPLRRDASFSG